MIYTVHVGPAYDEWPPEVGARATRAAATELAKERLRAAPPGPLKADVRLRGRLLDRFGRRATGSIRVVYHAVQRQAEPRGPVEELLPLEAAP